MRKTDEQRKNVLAWWASSIKTLQSQGNDSNGPLHNWIQNVARYTAEIRYPPPPKKRVRFEDKDFVPNHSLKKTKVLDFQILFPHRRFFKFGVFQTFTFEKRLF